MRTWGSALRGLSVSPPSLVARAVAAALEGMDAPLGAGSASSGATQVFNYPNFTGVGSAIVSALDAADVNAGGNGLLRVCNGLVGQHQAGGCWYATQINIASGFTTSFTFTLPNLSASIPSIAGMAFVVQNSNASTNAAGGYGVQAATDANLCGFGAYSTNANPGIGNSAAIKFDVGANSASNNSYPPTGAPSATGLYLNGGNYAALVPTEDLNPNGINLNLGHLMSATVVYDNTLQLMTMVLTDTVTGAQARKIWPINLTAVTNSNTAYVGFTGGMIPADVASISSWSFSTGFNARLATPTFSPAPGQYSTTQTVTISGPAGATLYYTTNGLLPTAAATRYTGAFNVTANTVVQAVAIQSGYTDSVIAEAVYQIGTANVINFPSGFAANDGVILNGYAYINGSAIQMSDSAVQSAVSGAWFAVPVGITTFTTNFTVVFTSSSPNGMTFCIQNQTPTSRDVAGNNRLVITGGPNAIFDNNGLGYAGNIGSEGEVTGINTSVAIALDPQNNATGLYTNASPPPTGEISISGLTLSSGHPMAVQLTYSGTSLTVSITDTVTSANFSHTFTGLDIATVVGGNNAYVGFTAYQSFANVPQTITSWTYN